MGLFVTDDYDYDLGFTFAFFLNSTLKWVSHSFLVGFLIRLIGRDATHKRKEKGSEAHLVFQSEK